MICFDPRMQRRGVVTPGARLYLDFGSDSESSSSPTNIDGRVTGGNDSINQSSSVVGSGNTVNITDAGAVSKSLDLAMRGIDAATSTSAAAIDTSKDVFSGALGLVSDQQKSFTTALENVKTADVRTLVIAGMAVVAVVGLSMFKKG